MVCAWCFPRRVLEVQAEVYVVDVSPFNIQAMRSAFRCALPLPFPGL